jgi:hypothetical protein
MSASQSTSREATSAEHVLFYRSVSYSIGREIGGSRYWAVYPGDGPVYGVRGGFAGATKNLGSFRSAVRAAEAAIDAWLNTHSGV